MQDFQDIIAKQRHFFATGATLPLTFRIEQLKKLQSIVQSYEKEIIVALAKDLGKPKLDALGHEIFQTLKEINLAIKKIKKWAQPIKIASPIFLQPGRSEIHFDPYGVVLIISPWNYPFALAMQPLVGAICAGNCVVLKPSEVTTHTEKLIIKIIHEAFLPEYIVALEANPEQMSELLKVKFDYIFFTGGAQVGKIIMEAAAKNMTPVTLELGGQNPCIVDKTADLDFAAKRIMWVKTTNAGQICLSVNHLYVHASCKDSLVKKLQETIAQFYGENPEQSESYSKIVNTNHFNRLTRLLENGHIITGGKTNKENLYIAPTLIDHITWDDPIMQEEIFGPLLPIFTYDNIEEVISDIKQKPKSLALYLFTQDKTVEEKILRQVSFGGGCINDCALHAANPNLPFGGVGYSGIGNYHGKFSFETFSHRKSIYKKTFLHDFLYIYPPYSEKKYQWIKRLLKLWT